MLKEILENVREKVPLIHSITNYVTANDCANILIASGARPIMADDIDEICEITSICDGLNINLGILNSKKASAMIAAAKKADELKHPILLDPVGVGTSRLRIKTVKELLENVKFTVIRGNVSEIKSLAGKSVNTSGVDADVTDCINEKNLLETVGLAKDFALKTGAIIVVTSKTDIVTDGRQVYCAYNGDIMMSKISGSGCQLSAMMTAYIAANKDDVLKAALGAVSAMGICGEIAKKRMNKFDGNASFRNYLIDAVYNLSPEDLEREARYEIG